MCNIDYLRGRLQSVSFLNHWLHYRWCRASCSRVLQAGCRYVRVWITSALGQPWAPRLQSSWRGAWTFTPACCRTGVNFLRKSRHWRERGKGEAPSTRVDRRGQWFGVQKNPVRCQVSESRDSVPSLSSRLTWCLVHSRWSINSNQFNSQTYLKNKFIEHVT